jgi:hypothetical protein
MVRTTKMLKSIFLGAFARGKGTNLLTVVVALTLATVTPAIAANGGNFLLGRSNTATAVTTLIKSGVGPALQLVVPAGQPPLRVNATAGKATNLNADKLDGQNSSAFLPVNGTAVNADKVDGANFACPTGTLLHEAVCIETTKHTGTNFNGASAGCYSEKSRLPTVAELQTFHWRTGHDFTAGEWTSDNGFDGTTFYASLVDPMIDKGITVDTNRTFPYRCVQATTP